MKKYLSLFVLAFLLSCGSINKVDILDLTMKLVSVTITWYKNLSLACEKLQSQCEQAEVKNPPLCADEKCSIIALPKECSTSLECQNRMDTIMKRSEELFSLIDQVAKSKIAYWKFGDKIDGMIERYKESGK